MNSGQFVFSQITQFLPKWIFEDIVKRYQGDKFIRHFSCWNQLLCMLFGQLTHRDSLRDLIVALEAHSRKSYHLGFGKKVTRSNLAKANEKRNFRIFEAFAYHLISVAQRKCAKEVFEIKGKIYAFDSTTIDLCLSVFWWATFRKKKAGIKLHTLYDIATQIPVFLHFTTANMNDMNAMDVITYEVDAYYIFDRGYVDYQRLYKITLHEAFFVVRAKTNLKFSRMYSRKVDKSTGVICDQIGKLSGTKTQNQYPSKIRRVKFYDAENQRCFVFLTNNFELSAEQIALLYKKRWQIELFFKWIKQHLKIKSFWGTTENAVRIQIYVAIIAYCLMAIIAKELKIDRSIYEIIQVIGISLLNKTPVNQLFTTTDYKNVKEHINNSLNINLF